MVPGSICRSGPRKPCTSGSAMRWERRRASTDARIPPRQRGGAAPCTSTSNRCNGGGEVVVLASAADPGSQAPRKFSPVYAITRRWKTYGPSKIGLVGFGTVGESFYRLLAANAEEFARRLGVAVDVPGSASATHRRAQRGGRGPAWSRAGGNTGRRRCAHRRGARRRRRGSAAARAGGASRRKHVITANKALLSAHGRELLALAAENGVELKFEAAVCGGIPIIKVLSESLLGNRWGASSGS